MTFRSLEDKTKWALQFPLINCIIKISFIEGSLYTKGEYALGYSLNLSSSVHFNKIDELDQINRPSPFECVVL